MKSAGAVAGSQTVVRTDSFGSKDPSYRVCFFATGFSSKESFSHAKFRGLTLKCNARLVNHSLHVRVIRAVVWALTILGEMGRIPTLNAKVRTARRVGIAMALTITFATFAALSFCAFAFSFAGFSVSITVFEPEYD